MTVAELVDRLSRLDPAAQVMVLDGANGGGVPRTINLGPAGRDVTADDVEVTADCEDLGAGTRIAVIGFGCY